MTHLQAKLVVAGAVLAAAIAYLAYAGVRAGRSYYLEVDSYLAEPEYHGQRVRLRGTVGEEDLALNPDGLSVSFQLLGESRKLRVEYRGVIPDMFKAGREVVVEGKMGQDGVFGADQLLTKCASKYDDDSGGTGRPG